MKKKTRLKLEHLISREVFGSTYLNDLNTICRQIQKHKSSIQRLRGYYLSQDNDRREGQDTYGYASIKKVQSTLGYIYDRFYCTFRLTWLLGLPEQLDSLKVKELCVDWLQTAGLVKN